MKAALKAMIPALALAGALLLTPSARADDRRGHGGDGYRSSRGGSQGYYSRGYGNGYAKGGYYGKGHGRGHGHGYYKGHGRYYARPYPYYRPYNRYYYAPPPYYSPYAQPNYYGYGPGYYAPPPPVYGPRFGIGLYFNF